MPSDSDLLRQLSERLTNLELLFMDLQRMSQELHEVALQQQRLIEALTVRVQACEAALQGPASEPDASESPDDSP